MSNGNFSRWGRLEGLIRLERSQAKSDKPMKSLLFLQIGRSGPLRVQNSTADVGNLLRRSGEANDRRAGGVFRHAHRAALASVP